MVKKGIMVFLVVLLGLSYIPANARIARAEIKPVKARSIVAKASLAHQDPEGFTLEAYEEYITARFEEWAQEARDGRGSNGDSGSADLGLSEGASGGADAALPEDAGEADESCGEYAEDSGEYLEEPEQDSEPDLIYLGDYTITFYCQCEQCCGRWAWSNSTASGAVPQAGWTVAAGESFPFGTILYIEGFGYYEVQDRGVPDGWVDIYVNGHSEIPGYGMTVASVYIVG